MEDKTTQLMQYVASSRIASKLEAFQKKIRSGIAGEAEGVNAVYDALLDLRPRLKKVSLDELDVAPVPQIAKTDAGIVIVQANGNCVAVSRTGEYLTKESQRRLDEATEFLKGDRPESSFGKGIKELSEKMVEVGLVQNAPYAKSFFYDRAYAVLKEAKPEEKELFTRETGEKPTKKGVKSLGFSEMVRILDGVMKKDVFVPYQRDGGYSYKEETSVSLSRSAPSLKLLVENFAYKMSEVEENAERFVRTKEEKIPYLLQKVSGGGKVDVGILSEIQDLLYESRMHIKALSSELKKIKNNSFLSAADSSPWFYVKNLVKFTCPIDAPSELTRSVVQKNKASGLSEELGLETRKSIRLVGVEKDISSLSLSIETALSVSGSTVAQKKKEDTSDSFKPIKKM